MPLGSLVQQLRYGVNIPKGTFVVMASGDRKVRAKILEKDTAHRGFSLPLPLNTAASDLKITPNYLLWFFSHNFVADHLLSHATGSVFLRVPKNVLLELPIPIPRGVAKRLVGKEIVMEKGKRVYTQLCFACHQGEGQGLPGVFPPLAKSDYLMADKTRATDSTIAFVTRSRT